MQKTAHFAAELRRDLCVRNQQFATNNSLPHVPSYGELPVIVYPPSDDGSCHGNFSDAAYEEIRERPEWFSRFSKVHSSARRSLPTADRRWRELDSSCSSDALLMNVFCYPGVWDDPLVAALLGVDAPDLPIFGFKARVPLACGRTDQTEVDMKFGDLLVESKLTESDFQSKDAAIVEGYRDFSKVFDRRRLPLCEANPERPSGGGFDEIPTKKPGRKYASYQLIRNVLAAHALNGSFCVMHDARRPDLREAWFEVISAVKLEPLQRRCKVLTWQELCVALPDGLREFLAAKYGIASI